MTMPPVMPAAIIAGAAVVGIGRTVHSSISVTVICRGVSTVVGGGVAVIVAWRIAVAIARAVPVGVRRKATDKGTGNQSARKARTETAPCFGGGSGRYGCRAECRDCCEN